MAIAKFTNPERKSSTLQYVTVSGTDGSETLTGSRNNNALILGYAGNDTIDGGTAHDTLEGGTGNDTYIVWNFDTTKPTQATIIEDASAGLDTLQITGTVANLSASTASIEVVQAMSRLDSQLTGNDLNNLILGNAGNDSLDGGRGNDTLDGSLGADTLRGGSGDDTYVYARGDGTDLIRDFGSNLDVDTLNFTDIPFD